MNGCTERRQPSLADWSGPMFNQTYFKKPIDKKVPSGSSSQAVPGMQHGEEQPASGDTMRG